MIGYGWNAYTNQPLVGSGLLEHVGNDSKFWKSVGLPIKDAN